MGKPTDGRSWVPVKARKVLTEYRDATRALAHQDRARDEGRHNEAVYFEVAGRYIEASQAICHLVSEQHRTIRSLQQQLGWVKRRRRA